MTIPEESMRRTDARTNARFGFAGPADLSFAIGEDGLAFSYECPCSFPRIATPLTHLKGLLSKHSKPAFWHLPQGTPDWSH